MYFRYVCHVMQTLAVCNSQSFIILLCYVLSLPLSLDGNNITDDGAIAVSEALNHCPQLKVLR